MTLFSTLKFLAQVSEERGIFWCFGQNDLVGWLVIFALAIASIWAWSTILSRRKYLNQVDKKNKRFEASLQEVNFAEYRARKGHGVSIYERLMAAGYDSFDAHGGVPETKEELTLRMSYVQNAVQRFLANMEEQYGEKLTSLGSCVTLGPFIGLLGTVYGIIITFASLSEKASIAQLAPGVSAALTATMCGLILAIPSVWAYNLFLAKSKKMYTELENFASIFVDNFEANLRDQIIKKQKQQAGTLEMAND